MMVADVPPFAMAVVAVDDPQFAQRFDNWRRWCIGRGFHQGHCASLEGDYSGPQGKGHSTGWGDWEVSPPPPSDPRVVIDIPDAIEVNRAYTRLATLAPTYARAIQVLVFQSYIKPTRQAQILGTHYTRLDDLLYRAKKMLRNQLQGQ